MALKATIFKATLNVADMDRNHYGEYTLTIARHPSETDERMLLRVLLFALHAHERLELGKGISDPDEPALWRKDLTGQIEEWIELGQPDERDLIRACGRATQVFVYGYGNAAKPWWELNAAKLERAKNLHVRRLHVEGEGGLAVLANRTMQLHCTVQDGDIWLGDGDQTVAVRCEVLRA